MAYKHGVNIEDVATEGKCSGGLVPNAFLNILLTLAAVISCVFLSLLPVFQSLSLPSGSVKDILQNRNLI